MSDPKCARMMLKLAAGDARALDVMRNPDDVTEEVFGFHLQQAAEKGIKAWIAVLGGLYELTHSLETLLDQLEECGADASAVNRFRGLAGYTPYAVEFRYQGVDDDTEPIDRNAAIALIAELLKHVGAALDAVDQ